MVKSFRILVPFPLVQQIGKTVNARQHIRMLLAQHSFRQRQRLSMYPLRLFVQEVGQHVVVLGLDIQVFQYHLLIPFPHTDAQIFPLPSRSRLCEARNAFPVDL